MLVFAHPGSEVDAERKKTSTLGESRVQPMSGAKSRCDHAVGRHLDQNFSRSSAVLGMSSNCALPVKLRD